ncbi:MAG: intracellular septation protein [Proteobacteria bacterium]|nr:intracellular septation protein [Pseudomonadota bacterium]
MQSSKNKALRSLFLGGIVPVVVYTILEEKAGPLWGLVFGMGFGILEILIEAFRYQKVETVTWIGNGLLVVMGGISLLTQEGIWFKLQPSILEAGMAVLLLGSWFLKKPLLVTMAKKQELPQILENRFAGVTFRLGIFFLLHSVLAAYAAFFWSTRAWALLKGVGLTLTMLLYLGIEVVNIRRSIHGR